MKVFLLEYRREHLAHMAGDPIRMVVVARDEEDARIEAAAWRTPGQTVQPGAETPRIPNNWTDPSIVSCGELPAQARRGVICACGDTTRQPPEA